jgi:toxin ParE1/3/4
MILLAPDAVDDVERLRNFLARNDPKAASRAIALIWIAVERLQEFPKLGSPIEAAGLRQIFVRFGTSGYVIRYAILDETGDILIVRIWHGRETRD